MDPRQPVLGTAVRRVDGRAKVTGQARYAADNHLPHQAYAVLVGSTVPSGRLRRLDAAPAERSPGVLLVLTSANRGPLGGLPGAIGGMLADNSRPPLADDEILFAGQYIAMVVAETIEDARAAAARIDVEYDPAPFAADPTTAPVTPVPRSLSRLLNKRRGDVARGLATAGVTVDATYTTAAEHGCALEPHATVAAWDGDALTVFDTTQVPTLTRATLTAAFGGRVDQARALAGLGKTMLLPNPAATGDPNVHVIAPYVGGMFGTKAITGSHVLLTALAARRLGRPVKTVLSRQQVLTAVGPRPWTSQRLELGATATGELTAIRHTSVSHTSVRDNYPEFMSNTTDELYATPSYASKGAFVRLNTTKPSAKRAPGEATTQFALESALDELAVALNLDPIELRRRNETATSPRSGLPFSSRHLMACYDDGARRFGWERRTAPPGSMRDGDELVGWGVATATLGAYVFGAAVRLRLEVAGERLRATLVSAASDAGMGTSTMLAMVVAEELGLPLDAVAIELGDSTLAPSLTAGGSTNASSLAPAARAACRSLRGQLLDLAAGWRPGFGRRQVDAVDFRGGQLVPREAPERALSLVEVMVEADRLALSATARTGGDKVLKALGVELNPRRRRERYAFRSFGAQFVEVRVQPDLGRLRVARVVSVFDVGRVLNPTGARSQLVGGIVMGLGTALFEELHYDPVHGGLATNDLAEYMIPVHADMPAIEVAWLDIPDPHISELGARGLGEISNTGIPAAVANAVYHATGRRLRDLPLTPEKIMS